MNILIELETHFIGMFFKKGYLSLIWNIMP